MESFKQLISVRRSIRTFTDQLLTDEEAQLLLRAALIAPTGKGRPSCRFVVVEDKATLLALSECKESGARLIAGAPLAIVVAADPNVTDIWVEDASIAATHILLQAEDLGLGACWVQVRGRATADGEPAEDIVRQILGLSPDLRVLCIVAVGHKAVEREPHDEDKLMWENVIVHEI